MDILKELEQKANSIYTIKCCQTEDNSCEACKKEYGNLEYCPKGYADEIIKALNKIDINTKFINKIIENL